jgi:NADH-ubiquinone oxidoreductase chain 4L
MNLSLILFLIGILGFVLNRKNIILMLISIEIMLLAITFLILISSLSFDDILGQTYAIYIIAIAGAESAIGLGILVAFYRLNSSLILSCLSHSNTTYMKKVKYSPLLSILSSFYFLRRRGGFLVNYKKRLLCEFIIRKIDLIVEHIIPFFDKQPIQGSKHLNFLYFKSAAAAKQARYFSAKREARSAKHRLKIKNI